MSLTPKQEKFCQLYIELGNASEAYRQSYDAENMLEASINRKAKELIDNVKISARISELRLQHRKRHNMTVDDLIKELEEARQAALDPTLDKPQSAAAVSATMGKAKLLGLDKQLVDITTNGNSLPSAITKEEFKEVAKEVLNEI